MPEIRDTIMLICAQTLSREKVEPDANLVLLGVDSMTAVEIVTQIELKYGVDVAETFFTTPTVQALATAVQCASTGSPLEQK